MQEENLLVEELFRPLQSSEYQLTPSSPREKPAKVPVNQQNKEV